MIDSIGIKIQDVILKPSSYSDLVSILKEPKCHTNNLINKTVSCYRPRCCH